ncbi:electron transfer protein 1, mitochondrial, partial [Jimgerdemannia flammicorona]
LWRPCVREIWAYSYWVESVYVPVEVLPTPRLPLCFLLYNTGKRVLSAAKVVSIIDSTRYLSFRSGGRPFTIHFITPEGEKTTVKALEKDTLLDLAQRYDIDLECACEGSLACSTCHVICEQEYYDKMPEPTDEENDMLDLAFGLTETSRLGCQIEMNKELDGLTVKIPSATRNVRNAKYYVFWETD